MPENARLSGCFDQPELEFVEREATPASLMTLSVQLHLAGLSLLNTISILDIFGVERSRSTVHSWVHKADLLPETGRHPAHVAVDETVLRLDDEQCWLYASAFRNKRIVSYEALTDNYEGSRSSFLAELRGKHEVEDSVFLVAGSASLQATCTRHGLGFRYGKQGNRNCIERIFKEIKQQTFSFSNCFSHAEADTANDWLRSFAFARNQLI